ncbi:hypothetical protein F2Q70_00029894 [Brassica cretica]|uniref:Uncharacterized protein n=1 Tax=Brassica cretica TaxID=69181 RepID=A0A8S9FR93_BRACR|nr:hypothetical protein F2Q70_00029894 [Brassica cretica]
MKASPNPTDESSSLSFTSLLTVLSSNSWRPPWGYGEVSSKKIKLESVLSSFDRSVVTRPSCRHSAQIVLSQSLGSISRGHSLALLTRRRSFCRHSIVLSSLDLLSSLDRSVVTRPLCRHLKVLSSLDSSVVTRQFCRHSTVLSSLDSYVVTRRFCRHLIILLSLDRSVVTQRRSFSCSYSAQIVLSQSLRSISHGHSTRSLAVTRCRSFSRSLSARSLVVTRSLSSLGADRYVVTRSFCRHLTVMSSFDRYVVV